MEVLRMLVDLEIALDAANLTWAHGVLLGLTCLSLLAVTVNRWLRWKNSGKRAVDKLAMVKIEIPFSLTLEDGSNVVTVKSAVANKVEIYWDFYFQQFYNALKKRWTIETVMDASKCGCLNSEEGQIGEKNFVLDVEDVFSYSVPRPSFFVGIVIRNLKKNLKTRDILGLVTIIDLGNPANPNRNAKIVGRFLKLGSGQVTALQRFFPSGLCQDDISDLCVVCRDSPITRVALPCRHACYCTPCFERVSNCSMCTADINSFFCIEPGVDDVD